MVALYNEIDPYCAEWLRNLILVGEIPDGVVDERPVQEIEAWELAEYDQCHFFAGIGGWPAALRLAGWPDDRPVWTGSCPCQPFSNAGARGGTDDERHLWPFWFPLIRERAPSVVFGEQVASPLGREWLAGVRTDLEDARYEVGCADLPAAGVGAPHIRQRLWWVANGECNPGEPGRPVRVSSSSTQPAKAGAHVEPGRRGAVDELANGSQQQQQHGRGNTGPGRRGEHSDSGVLGNNNNTGLPASECEAVRRTGRREEGRATGEPSSPWWPADLVFCRDGKQRRIEPGTFPLAHGIPARVAKLRAFGNAIVPQVAAKFIQAYLEARR